MAKLALVAVVMFALASPFFSADAQHKQENKLESIGQGVALTGEGKKAHHPSRKNVRDIGGYGGSRRSMLDPGVAGVPGGQIGRGTVPGERHLPDNVMQLRE